MNVSRHSAARGLLALAALPCLVAGAAVSLLDRGQDAAPPDAAPRVVDPGAPGTQPSDAVVLFDGTDLSQWSDGKGGDAKWKVAGGVMEVNGTGSIVTKRKFGDQQVHIEFATPAEVKGEARGAATAASTFRAGTRSRCSTRTRARRTRTASAAPSTGSRPRS